jgi:predicted TPR repeat methyltransferase
VNVPIDGTAALKLRPDWPGQYSAPTPGEVAALYDEDYYERGVEKGISGYSNYRWIPELTIPMAMTIVDTLGIRARQRVLDFGCAKGFTVKALRMLQRDAHGIDISSYAIAQAPHDVAPFCHLTNDLEAFAIDHSFDFVLAKDVLEHVPYESMEGTLASIAGMGGVFMAVVPLGLSCADGAKRFIIEAYERDITHIVREPAHWWRDQLALHWRDVSWRHHVAGIKDNWHAVDPLGNAVLIARDPRA